MRGFQPSRVTTRLPRLKRNLSRFCANLIVPFTEQFAGEKADNSGKYGAMKMMQVKGTGSSRIQRTGKARRYAKY